MNTPCVRAGWRKALTNSEPSDPSESGRPSLLTSTNTRLVTSSPNENPPPTPKCVVHSAPTPTKALRPPEPSSLADSPPLLPICPHTIGGAKLSGASGPK